MLRKNPYYLPAAAGSEERINSVSEKIDTKELKRPFVRGDAARSNADGNGLGLSIAERAALANGFRLTISCTDTAFRAEVIF